MGLRWHDRAKRFVVIEPIAVNCHPRLLPRQKRACVIQTDSISKNEWRYFQSILQSTLLLYQHTEYDFKNRFSCLQFLQYRFDRRIRKTPSLSTFSNSWSNRYFRIVASFVRADLPTPQVRFKVLDFIALIVLNYSSFIGAAAAAKTPGSATENPDGPERFPAAWFCTR